MMPRLRHRRQMVPTTMPLRAFAVAPTLQQEICTPAIPEHIGVTSPVLSMDVVLVASERR